ALDTCKYSAYVSKKPVFTFPTIAGTCAADLLGFYLGDVSDSMQKGMVLTAPYASMNSIVVRSKASSFPGDGLVGAVIEGRGLPGTIRADRVEFFHNASDALEAVNRGEIDFVYGLASYMEYEIQK
ncbi:hypothetical protein NE664_15900, partial [Anaerotignum faecicola]|nr:hypothetical protein [Anaerotignum faecicola]